MTDPMANLPMALRVAQVAADLSLWFLTQSLLPYRLVPERMIWWAPGVPPLLVTYITTNDHFFCGHTALGVYGSIVLGQW
jgi:hypothetical protein